MTNFLFYSVLILSVIVIIEMIFMYKLTKSIRDFLIKFKTMDDRIVPNTLKIGERAPVISVKNQYNKALNFKNYKVNILIFKDELCGSCKDITFKLHNLIDDSSYRKSKTNISILQQDLPSTKMLNMFDHYIHKKPFIDYSIDRVPTVFIINNHGEIISILDKIGGYEDFKKQISNYTSIKVS